MIGSFALADPVSVFACYVPKPLYLQTRPADMNAPSDRARTAVERLVRLYRLCGSEERLRLDVQRESASFDDTGTISFLEHWL
jgi:hypothetical protein